ncbi:hypothetical protein MRB53_000917 [Persea americana]|uniref:Uncharacterized protein n=1 Tax=Persea americana TaxID=3435 RepID=A0ACC2MR89_PERAE|nr:hypothetical protein MRB53_000917 [Persea americana]|eukprot:TRINITY_DN21615_c0_g2_i5.p1 TRINITY_DN21615_c0_g2~~TRINITY_DN21615_c0_g2_i5.p1  ORF type:complete len:236 (-),score=42.70 TRINITY_DN21615_c0_g2_i5:832-1539(-)
MAHMQCSRNLLRQLVKETTAPNSSHTIHPLLVGQGLRFRKLEVILTTSVDKLGKAGETVKVAPGYFRNHLMPKLLAVPNIDKYAYLIREQRKIYQREEVETVTVVPKTKEDKMKEYQAAAKRLDNAHLVWNDERRKPIQFSKNGIAQVEDYAWFFSEGLRRLIKVDNELREPVTKDELVAEVARQLSVSIQPENLHLPSPITSLGEFEIPLRLPKSIPLPVGKLHWTLDIKIWRR